MKLLRITVLVQRFTVNCSPVSRQCKQNIVGFIRSEELQKAKQFWLLKTQAETFRDEIAALKVNKLVPRHSCLKQLNPFIDTLGLIRVGGRLANAPIAESKRVPIVLPFKGKITQLLFEYEHCKLLHIRPQSLLAHMNNECWPI